MLSCVWNAWVSVVVYRDDSSGIFFSLFLFSFSRMSSFLLGLCGLTCYEFVSVIRSSSFFILAIKARSRPKIPFSYTTSMQQSCLLYYLYSPCLLFYVVLANQCKAMHISWTRIPIISSQARLGLASLWEGNSKPGFEGFWPIMTNVTARK
ncbi:hypothetical protein F4810DRAFT_63098 [Camillea tinctor]|nr:hypothetical protein F4810DRAFT_63098 [Camillea tinctor]